MRYEVDLSPLGRAFGPLTWRAFARQCNAMLVSWAGFAPMMIGAMRRANRKDLRRLKRILEGRPPQAPATLRPYSSAPAAAWIR